MLFDAKVDIKIVKSPSFDPWYNLALEEYLLEHLLENQIILYLWQNENTVVIGKNQNPWKECKWRELENDGGKLARRISGGGAVYHDLGNLNFTFIADKKLYNEESHFQIIINALKRLGIDAQVTKRKDIFLDGKKFSGNAFYFGNDRAYHHGTLLIDADLLKLNSYLQGSKEKIDSKGVDSVRSKVVNLSSVEKRMTIKSTIKALEESFNDFYGKKSEEILVDDLKNDLNILYDKHTSWKWRYGSTPKFHISFGERFSWGDVELFFEVNRGNIQKTDIQTTVMDDSLIDKISASLEGVDFRICEIVDKIDLIDTTLEEKRILEDLKNWLMNKEI